MKFLLISGASKSVLWFRKELIKYLQDKQNEVVVVCCDNDNEKTITEWGVTYICIPGDNRDINPISNLRYISKLKRVIKQVNPDRVMTFQAKANTFGLIAAKLAGQKHLHAMIEGLGNVFNGEGFKSFIIKTISLVLYRTALRKINTVFFLNKENKKVFLNKKLVKENQTCLINGIGVDLEYFAEEELPSDDIIKFVMVARTVKEKGCVEYCDAAKKVKDSGVDNVEFMYFGDSGEKEDIVKQYHELGYVNYGGYTNDIKAVLKNCHVMVLPTYHEGVPRSLMEAAAIGRGIIATNIPGCDVTVVDGANGFFIEKRNVDDLVEKLMFFVNDKEKISEMGKASRALAELKFDSNLINDIIYKRID